jgi:hypothetical protein
VNRKYAWKFQAYFQIAEKVVFSQQFFILPEWFLQMGLLISSPGTRFPPVGSPVTSISRRSRVPSAPINRKANQPNVLHHTFSNLAKYFAIFSIFWQVAVRKASSLAFFNPLNRQ